MTSISPELAGLGPSDLIKLLKSVGGSFKAIIENRIKELIKSKNYLVSNSEQEVKELYKITKQDLYKRLEGCLISHWSMNLIALGIFISKLNESGQREIVERVRVEVHRKYQAKGIRILTMGSTGAINHIIEYLSNLKMGKNYNFKEMGVVFDGIIDKWEGISIFIKSGDDVQIVKEKLLDYLNKKEILFFIFAYGQAVKATINSIAELNNQGKLSGFLWDAKMKKEGEKDVYSCTFESIEGYGIDMFS